MYKYICKECGAKFDEPREYEERHGFKTGPFEKWSVCPECSSSGYEESFGCECCGEIRPISERNTVQTDCGNVPICDDCGGQ